MKDRATPDDPVTCGLCGKETSLAMIVIHLANEHGIDPQEIADAPVVDRTEEPAAVTPPPEEDRPGPDWQAIP